MTQAEEFFKAKLEALATKHRCLLTAFKPKEMLVEIDGDAPNEVALALELNELLQEMEQLKPEDIFLWRSENARTIPIMS